MNEQERLIVSDFDSKTMFNKGIVLGGIAIAAGLFLCIIGFSMSERMGPYASDSELMGSVGMALFGFFGIVCGIAIPILFKKLYSNVQLVVFADHIEGTAPGNVNFHERMENISSVTVANPSFLSEKAVVIHLKDARKLNCVAKNADEIARTIRELI